MAKLAQQAISNSADEYINKKADEWSCPRAEVVRRILDGHVQREKDALNQLLLNAKSDIKCGKVEDAGSFLKGL